MQNILDSSNNKNSNLDMSVQIQKGHVIEYSYFLTWCNVDISCLTSYSEISNQWIRIYVRICIRIWLQFEFPGVKNCMHGTSRVCSPAPSQVTLWRTIFLIKTEKILHIVRNKSLPIKITVLQNVEPGRDFQDARVTVFKTSSQRFLIEEKSHVVCLKNLI